MREKWLVGIAVGIGLVGLIIFVGIGKGYTAPSSQLSETPELHTITVNGEGQVLLTPDFATISIGVQTEDKEAAKAVSSNNKKSQEVLTKLTSFGIPEKDIQTSNFSVYPRQQYDENGKPLETTYVVENTVFVKVNDLKKIGEILDTVIKAGANTINNIQFDVSDSTSGYNQALETAITNARAKAEIAAKAAGTKLGPVHTLQVISGGEPIPVSRKMIAAAPSAPDVPISPGQMNISVSVTVVYLIGG